MSEIAGDGLSEYELQRRKNIARNQHRLLELGLHVPEVLPIGPPKRLPSTKPARAVPDLRPKRERAVVDYSEQGSGGLLSARARVHVISRWHRLKHIDAPNTSGDDAACAVCGEDRWVEGNELLLCDGLGCGCAYHMSCLQPSLDVIPEGEWFCPVCKDTSYGASVLAAGGEHCVQPPRWCGSPLLPGMVRWM